jgi:hypothetical protein
MAKIFYTSETDSAVKFMYYFSKALGLIPFTYIVSGSNFEFKISLLSLIWTASLLSFHVVTYYIDLTSEANSYDKPSVYDVVGTSVKLYSLCCYLISVLVLLYNRRNLNTVINKLIQLDYALKPRHINIVFFMLIQHCVAFVLISSSSICFWLRAQVHRSTFLVIIPIAFSDVVVELHFVNFILLLKHHFSDINSRLELASLTTDRSNRARLIRLLVPLHDSLCDVSVLVNSVYSPVTLSGVGNTFIAIVYIIYFIAARFLDFNTPEVDSAMKISLILCTARLFNLVRTCYSCSCEVSNVENVSLSSCQMCLLQYEIISF